MGKSVTSTLEIHCHKCSMDYEVLPECVRATDNLPDWLHPYRCPRCMAQMNTRTWDKLVTAYWELWEVNKELLGQHTGYKNHPLFQASCKTHCIKGGQI